MPSRISVAVWSPDWRARTGQGIVTERVVEHQEGVNWYIANYGDRGLASLMSVVPAVLRLYFAIVFRGVRTAYLVTSRSNLGFIRDIPALLLPFFGVRTLVHVHGSDFPALLKRSPLARRLYAQCEVIVPSKHLIPLVEEIIHCRPRLCENFAPTGDVSELPEDAQESGIQRIVWNSNIMASKGVFDVAAAAALARRSLPKLKLLLLGRPMGDEELSDAAATEKLEELKGHDWVEYIGPVPSSMATAYTGLADLYLLPSRYSSECQPLALIQAMCLGKPIIVADTPALRATVGEYPAKLVAAPVPERLAQAIEEQFLGSSAASMTDEEWAQAALDAKQRFSEDRFDLEMRSILESTH